MAYSVVSLLNYSEFLNPDACYIVCSVQAIFGSSLDFGLFPFHLMHMELAYASILTFCILMMHYFHTIVHVF